MNVLRKILLWLSNVTFRFLLLTTVLVSTMIIVFGNPIHIKKVIKDSNVYSTFVDAMIEEIRKSPANNQDNSFPINDPVIQKDIKDAFTPEFLQTSTEKVVDGSYRWLTGKVAKPDFVIDFTAQKQQLANSIGDFAVAKLSVLPVCTRLQLLQITGDVDPFKATCRPSNLDILAQRQQIVNNLMTSKDFLSKTVITADSLPKNKNGQTIFQQKAFIPKFYGWISLSPILLGGILCILALMIIFLQEKNSRRNGIRSVGMALGGTGLFLAASSFVAMWFYKHASQSGGPLSKVLGGENNFQQPMTHLFDSITQLVNARIMQFGIGYAVTGGLILVILFFTRPKKKTPIPDPQAEARANLETDGAQPVATTPIPPVLETGVAPVAPQQNNEPTPASNPSPIPLEPQSKVEQKPKLGE